MLIPSGSKGLSSWRGRLGGGAGSAATVGAAGLAVAPSLGNAALIEPLGALVGLKAGKLGLRRLGLRFFLRLVRRRPARPVRRFLACRRPGGIGRISAPEAQIARILRWGGAGEEKRGDPDRRACAPSMPRGTEKARGHRRS